MKITFRDDWLGGRGPLIRVRRDDTDFGIILQTGGVYRFYTGEEVKLGGADLEGADLEHLKARLKEKYERKR